MALFPSKQTEIDRVYKEHGKSSLLFFLRVLDLVCVGPKEISKKDFFEMVSYAITPSDDSPFPFLYIDVFAKPDDRFRRNYTERLEISQLAEPGLELEEEDEAKQGGVKRGSRFEDPEASQKTRKRKKKDGQP